MTPTTQAIPLPEALPLPGPVWLLHGLLLLAFFLHVVAMNLMLGGALVGTGLWWRRRGGWPAHDLSDAVAHALPTTVAATVSLGVAALLFAQVLYGRLLFTSSVLMAWAWLGVVPAVIVAYYATYTASLAPADRRRRARLAITVAALALLGVAFVYANNTSLMLRPDEFAARYARDAAGWWLNLDDPTLPPRYLHAILGAAAAGGWGLALLAAQSREPEVQQYGFRHGMTWLAAATGANVVAGGWWFMALDRPVRRLFHGGDLVASAVLALGVLLAIGLGTHAWRARTNPRGSRALVTTGVTLASTLLLMVLTRDTVREATLGRYGFTPVPWVAPQWTAIALFLVLLLAALGSIAWMVRALWVAGDPRSPVVSVEDGVLSSRR